MKKSVIYFYGCSFTLWRRRLAGIYAVARKEGWLMHSVDVGELTHGVRPVIDYWKPDGMIVEGGVFRYDGCDVASFEGRTVVYCDADAAQVGPRHFGVYNDSSDVVRRSLRELLSCGFDSYAYVHYRTRRDWSDEREAFFRKELSRRGLRASVFRPWKDAEGEDGAAFGRRLEAFLAALPKPCAVLAANDEMAAHVLRAAECAAISVPEEMAVMGVDNDELVCENTFPTLSSVSPAFERSGRLAAGLLARRFKKPQMAPEVLSFGSLPVERRHSTRKAVRSDLRVIHAVEYVRVNACKGVSVADVVGRMGLRTRTAENRFRAYTGHSIRDELLANRIAHAQKLLSDPKVSLDAVYQRCGYRDPRSLRYVFTKATGLSPLAWRRRHLAQP